MRLQGFLMSPGPHIIGLIQSWIPDTNLVIWRQLQDNGCLRTHWEVKDTLKAPALPTRSRKFACHDLTAMLYKTILASSACLATGFSAGLARPNTVVSRSSAPSMAVGLIYSTTTGV